MSGIWPVFQGIRSIEVSDGRLINELDNAQARRVVVIGREASKQLFADRNPVGSALKLNGLTYTVIGRVRQKFQDSNYSGPDDRRLFVPYEAMRRDFPMHGAVRHPGFNRRHRGGAVPVGGRFAPSSRWTATRSTVCSVSSARPWWSRKSGTSSRPVHGFDEGRPRGAVALEHRHRVGDVQQDDSGDEELLPGREPDYAGARRHRRDEHHAGRRAGAHAGNRPAQGAGGDAGDHSPAVHRRRRRTDVDERHVRVCRRHRARAGSSTCCRCPRVFPG